MRVAILDDYQGVALDSADWSSVQARAEVTVYRDHLADESAVADRLQGANAVILMRERTPFPRSLFERLPNLRLLVTAGMRNASIDLRAAADHGVTVCGTEGEPHATAELTWGLILSLARQIPTEHAATRNGQWQTTVGMGIHGKTLGVIGLERLGSQVANAGLAFGMNVVAWSQNLTRERTDEVGVELAASKEALLEAADIVTIHLVLSDRTRGLLGAAELAKMRPSAYLVNSSRGPIVDEDALLDTLRNRRIAGAGLDVFEQEPLPAGHPFLSLDNVVVTPHLGYVTTDTYAIFYGHAAENIIAFMDGAPKRVLSA